MSQRLPKAKHPPLLCQTPGDDDGGPFLVGAAGRVYVTNRDGVAQVMSHGKATPDVLAVNRLDDTFSASAAIAGLELFLRGERSLYCIADE